MANISEILNAYGKRLKQNKYNPLKTLQSINREIEVAKTPKTSLDQKVFAYEQKLKEQKGLQASQRLKSINSPTIPNIIKAVKLPTIYDNSVNQIESNLKNARIEQMQAQKAMKLNDWNKNTLSQDFQSVANQGKQKSIGFGAEGVMAGKNVGANIIGSAFNISGQKNNAAKYLMMNQKEKDLYFYLKETQGTQKANEYLKDIDGELSTRLADGLSKLDNKGLEIANSFVAGYDNAMGGFEQAAKRLVGLENPVEQSASEKVFEQNNLTGGAKVASDILYGVGNMAPSIAVGIGTGGLGFAGNVAGAATMGTSIFGSTYADTKREGYSDTESLTYASINAGLEAGLQYALGGITKLSGTGGLSKLLGKTGMFSEVSAKLAKTPVVVQVLSKYAAQGGNEAVEEYLQAVIDPVVRNLALNENNDTNPLTADKVYSAFLGFLTASALNSPNIPSDIKAQIQSTPEIQEAIQVAKEIHTQNQSAPDIKIEQPQDIVFKQPQTTTDSVLTPQEPITDVQPIQNMNTPIAEEIAPSVPVEADVPIETRGYAETLQSSENISDPYRKMIGDEIANENFSYVVQQDIPAIKNAEQTIKRDGIDNALAQWKSVANGTNVATKNDIVLGETLLKLAQERGDTKTFMEIASELAIEGTRMGQAIQAYSIINKLTPSGKAFYLEKVVQKLNKELQVKYKTKAPTIALNESLVGELLQSQNQEQIDASVDKIQADISKQVPTTLAEKINAWRYLAMLGNPKTHIRNIVGNSVMDLLRRGKNAIAVLLEKGISKENRTKAVLTPKDKPLIDFSREQAKLHRAEMLVGGKFGFETEINRSKTIFNNKILEGLRKLNDTLLNKEDEFFMNRAYSDSMARYLKAKGYTVEQLTNGTKESNTILENARQYSMLEAQKATFRDYSKIAATLNKLEKQNPVTEVLIAGLVPFKKTPINILKRGIEYSPVGLVNGVARALYDLKQGNYNSAQFVDRISSGLTGSAVVIIGSLLASMGVIKAGAGDDENKEYFDQNQGIQPYSIRIGDKTFTLDWLTPSSMPLFIGVEMYDVISQQSDAQTALSRITDAMTRVSDPLLQLSMLQGLNDTISGFSQDGVLGSVGNALTNAALGYAGQFVPTVLGQVARTIDPVRRTTYASSDNGQLAKSVEQAGRKQLNKIPGASTLNEPYIDLYGQEQTNANNPVLRALENAVFPFYMNNVKDRPIDKELSALYEKTGENVLPTAPKPSLKKDNKTYYFTPNEYTNYKKTVGKTVYDIGNKIIQGDAYKGLTDAEKVSVIEGIKKYSTAIATSDYFASKGIKHEVDKWIINAKSNPAEAILNRVFEQSQLDANAQAKENFLSANGYTVKTESSESTVLPVDYSNIPSVPSIKGAELISKDEISGKLTSDVLERLNEIGMNPQDYYYVKARVDAYPTAEQPAYLQSLGLTGKDLTESVETFVMTTKDRAKMTLANDSGIDNDTYINAYIASNSFKTDQTQAQHNAQLVQYINELSITDEQKVLLFEQLKEGKGTTSSGGGGGSSAPKIKFPTIKAPAKTQEIKTPKLANVVQNSRLRNVGYEQELKAIQQSPFLTAAQKAGATKALKERYKNV